MQTEKLNELIQELKKLNANLEALKQAKVSPIKVKEWENDIEEMLTNIYNLLGQEDFGFNWI